MLTEANVMLKVANAMDRQKRLFQMWYVVVNKTSHDIPITPRLSLLTIQRPQFAHVMSVQS